MIPIVTFVGWHNSGKTTFIRKVIKEIMNRGYRVAVFKSSKHESVQFDRPGKDSYNYRADGADPVLFLSPDQLALFSANSGRSIPKLAFHHCPDADIVICEGFKHASGIPKIEIRRDTLSGELMETNLKGIVAVVTDKESNAPNHFGYDEHAGVADFIESRYIKPAREKSADVTLFVNGKRIPLKDFVQESLYGTLMGFIGALKFTEGAKEVELRIRQR